MNRSNFSKGNSNNAPNNPSDPAKPNKPVNEIRIGMIKASIWSRTFDDGVAHNVTFSRIYKSGEEWRRSESFGRDDLLVVAKVADLAHTWIVDQHVPRGTPRPEEG